MAGVKTNASLSARQSFEYLLPTRFAQCREWQRVKSPPFRTEDPAHDAAAKDDMLLPLKTVHIAVNTCSQRHAGRRQTKASDPKETRTISTMPRRRRKDESKPHGLQKARS